MANAEGSTEAPCPGEKENDGGSDDDGVDDEGKIYILYGFLVTAGIIFLFGFFWVYLTIFRVLDPIREDNA